MAYQATVDYRYGEMAPLTASFSVVSGSGTIAGVASGSTFSLFDPQSQTLIDRATEVRVEMLEDLSGGTVFYDLDSRLLPGPNIYYGQFSYRPVATDLILRISEPEIQVRVLPRVEVVATFDPLTARGRLRMELQDKADFQVPGTAIGITNPIYSDAEVDAFLHQANSSLVPTSGANKMANCDLYMAAYYGWNDIAANKATLVKVKKILFIQSNTMPTYQAALDRANGYLVMAQRESSIGVTASTGSYDPARPEWQGYPGRLTNW